MECCALPKPPHTWVSEYYPSARDVIHIFWTPLYFQLLLFNISNTSVLMKIAYLYIDQMSEPLLSITS